MTPLKKHRQVEMTVASLMAQTAPGTAENVGHLTCLTSNLQLEKVTDPTVVLRGHHHLLSSPQEKSELSHNDCLCDVLFEIMTTFYILFFFSGAS